MKREKSITPTLSDEERNAAIEFVQKSTQLIGLVSTYADFGEIASLTDWNLDLEKEFKSIKKKIIAVLLASSILPEEDKQQIMANIEDEIDFDEDEEQVSKDFDISASILYKYIGKSKDVVVPVGVERISGCAFHGFRKKLKSIKFPRSLQMICEHAFMDCTKLKEITISQNVTDVDKLAFCGCKRLEKVHFENPDIVKIGNRAFDNTPWMDKALKSNGALIVGNNLLKVSPNLTKYEIPSHITSICGGAFAKSSIVELIIPEGVTYIGEHAFDSSSLQHISLPNSLTHIDDYAFANCISLEELTLPENVSSIGDHTLYNLPNCIVTILNGNEDEKTEIYDCSFGGKDFLLGDTLPYVKMVKAPYGSKAMRVAMLWNLPFVPLDGIPKIYTYIDEIFCCEGTKLHNYLGHEKIVQVPEGITELGDDSFSFDYGRVERVILPESVTTINACAFCWATSLKTIEGAGVKSLEKYAFGNCKNLEKVSFPNLETMSEAAFDRCPSLTEENLLVPENVVVEERGFSLFSLMKNAMAED